MSSDDLDEFQIGPSEFVDTGSVGFGIAFIADRDTDPVINVVTVDFATGQELTHQVRRGEPFQAAGQTWRVDEFRLPPEADRRDAADDEWDDWQIVLRRIGSAP